MNFAKVRLNARHRCSLYDHAKKVIVFEKEQHAESGAFFALKDAIDIEVKGFATPRELAILRKFKAVGAFSKVTFVFDDDGVSSKCDFAIKQRDIREPRNPYRDVISDGPIVRAPNMFRGNYQEGLVLPGDVSARLRPLFNTWQKAVKAHDEVRNQALEDLFALFRKSTTLSAVVELWPPGADIANSLGYVPPPTDASILRIRKIKCVRKAST